MLDHTKPGEYTSKKYKSVAVMQPYFFPYGGYFSLMSIVDHFVFFDCVQFPRRGWVHRNRVPGPTGTPEWLTLPLAYQPRDVLIQDLAFAPDARARLLGLLPRYSWLAGGSEGAAVREMILPESTGVCDYLVGNAMRTASLLGLAPRFSRSSALALPADLKGEARVIAAARAVGGTHYLNLSGGSDLYDGEQFRNAGLRLSFLRSYQGPTWSMLFRLCTEDPSVLSDEIKANAAQHEA